MTDAANRVQSEQIWDRALLDALLHEDMSDSLRMLIVRDMALIADDAGRAPLPTLAQRIRNFFSKRLHEGKCKEHSEALAGVLYGKNAERQNLQAWEKLISAYAAASVGDFVAIDKDVLTFRPDLWSRWTPSFRKALRNVAETRLIEYFETRVEGGW